MQKFINSIQNKLTSGIQEAFVDAKTTLVSRMRDDLEKEAFKGRHTMKCVSGFSFRISRRPLFNERIFICVEHILRYSTKDLTDVRHSYNLKATVSGRDTPFEFSCHAEAFSEQLRLFVATLMQELSVKYDDSELNWAGRSLSDLLVEYEVGIHQILK